MAILAQAAESPDGLTQASIINAARNFEYTPSMGRDGVVYKMNGEEDRLPRRVDADRPVRRGQRRSSTTSVS